MTRPNPDINTATMHPARRYNYWLGGKDNFAADRASGDLVAAAFPGIRDAAKANRAFLGRAVRFLAGEAGIRQFLDIGTGLPTAGNTHDVAQNVAPESRIVYVDNDPIVLAHARALLTSTPQGRTAYIDADARAPEEVLAASGIEILDFNQPVAVLLVAVLHFFPDDDVAKHVVETLVAAMAPGSYLAMSHAAARLLRPDAEQLVRTAVAAEPFKLRTDQEVAEFSAGLEVVAPGIVPVQRWRPDPGQEVLEDHNIGMYAFVARKVR
ncbi:SAM-dependent methyltransferase [Actinoplanes sp. NPDC051411]|uniref:SAM-dependent methyltransferase n=1 Tax=Actinoplanes sp. NPDC051411 TaxID=3155522 RepID=UPI0034200622